MFLFLTYVFFNELLGWLLKSFIRTITVIYKLIISCQHQTYNFFLFFSFSLLHMVTVFVEHFLLDVQKVPTLTTLF